MVGVRLWHFRDLALISPITNAGVKNDLSQCIKTAMVLDNRIKEENVGVERKLNHVHNECPENAVGVWRRSFKILVSLHNESVCFHMHMQNLVCLNRTLGCFQCSSFRYLRSTVYETKIKCQLNLCSFKWSQAWIDFSVKVIWPQIRQNRGRESKIVVYFEVAYSIFVDVSCYKVRTNLNDGNVSLWKEL